MNNTNKNPPSYESGFCLAPTAGLEPAAFRFAEYCVIRRVRPTNSKHLPHAYFRKYSRLARLGTLGFNAPYFRYLPSQKDYQSFCSLAYQHRLVQSYWEYMTVNPDVASYYTFDYSLASRLHYSLFTQNPLLVNE